MADIWFDVDTALSEVPVNLIALTDDTDFKTREESVTYNQSGLDLVWNFVTTAGAMAQTAVTPTDTGGAYDWVNQGNGMYSIEIPASGGASINNDTEGFGWFTGFATGILPWRGPMIGFRAAGLNDKLIDSAYSATRGLAGTALPDAAADAAGGLPISDDGGLDMDAIKEDTAAILADTGTDGVKIADNAITSDKFDESTAFPLKSADTGATAIARTGADSDTLETLSDQIDGVVTDIDAVESIVSGLGLVGAAVNKVAESATVTTGSETGTYANTHADDGTYWQVTAATSEIDTFLQYDIGTDATPVSVSINGRLHEGSVPSGGDSIAIYAYDNVASGWELVSAGYTGIANSTAANDAVKTANLLAKHVDTSGKVKIRFYGTVLEANTALYVDQAYVSYAVTGSRVGYSDGAIWIDTNASNTDTTPYVDGTADNPVSTVAAANTLAAALGLHRFRIAPGSSITFAASQTSEEWIGKNWTLALGGQDITNTLIEGAKVSGIGTSTAGSVIFEYCGIGTATLPPGRFYQCGIGRESGTFTGGQTGNYTLIDCFSLVPGSGTPALTFAGVGNTVGVNIRRWSGGSSITLDSDVTLSMEVVTGGGQTFDLTAGGNVEVRGTCRAVTLTGIADGSTAQIACVTGPIGISGTGGIVNIYGVCGDVTDTTSPAATVTNKAISRVNVNLEADTALSDYDPPTKTEMDSAFTTTNGKIDNLDSDVADVFDDVGTVQASVDFILADTNELQVELADGGRTDLLIDGIKAKTDNLPADPADDSDIDTQLAAIKAETASILSDTGTDGVMVSSAGVTAIWNKVLAGTTTMIQAMRAVFAFAAGKLTGGGSTSRKFRNEADDKDVIDATVDEDGNRTAVTLDLDE